MPTKSYHNLTLTRPFTVKEATEITGGGLNQVEKMPEKTYNLPPEECGIGMILADIEGTACSECYALKNLFKLFKKTISPAQYARFESLTNEEWAPAMAYLINRYCEHHFRWHSAGEIQDIIHLQKICHVAELTPQIEHWLPSREYKIILDHENIYGPPPPNLIIRRSGHMIDGGRPFPLSKRIPMSAIHRHKQPDPAAYICPAKNQGGHCDGRSRGGINCRECWNPNQLLISYPYH